MTTKTRRYLHRRLELLAYRESKQHFVEDDGERCFNLVTFLDAIESQLHGELYGPEALNGRFELSAPEVARYLWCCLALKYGDAPDGTTFRGCPILD